MVYVEWLRVRGALKWTAIVLGILLVFAFVGRFEAAALHHGLPIHEMKLEYYVIVGAILAMIVATVLGAPFARENDGHLEVAFTKPVDRTVLALKTIGVDVAGIAAVFPLGIVFAIIGHAILYPMDITFHFDDVIAILLGIMAPLAWYAMLAAATASLKRGYGAILGIAWPVAALVAGLGLVDGRGDPMLTLLHDTFWTLSRLDPLAYTHFGSATAGHTLIDPAWLFQLTMLAVLALGYGALAVVQWRRVED
jgi:hypothetical protein